MRLNQRRFAVSFATLVILAAVALFLLPVPVPAVDVSTHSIVVGDTERFFRVALPHNPRDPAPVVFAFHGIGDSTESMAVYSGLDVLAADQGFLLVYPEGLNAMWSAIEVDPNALDANVDVQFFDALLEHLAAQYAIDRTQIYLIGMSNGASFVQLLAHARSTEVAAAVACSGLRPTPLNDAPRPFPILLIVGGEDSVAGAMQSDYQDYQAKGHEAEFILVRGLGHQWPTRYNPDVWTFLSGHVLSP